MLLSLHSSECKQKNWSQHLLNYFSRYSHVSGQFSFLDTSAPGADFFFELSLSNSNQAALTELCRHSCALRNARNVFGTRKTLEFADGAGIVMSAAMNLISGEVFRRI